MALFDWVEDLDGMSNAPAGSLKKQEDLRQMARAKFPTPSDTITIKGGIASAENKNPVLDIPKKPETAIASPSSTKSPLEQYEEKALGPPGQPSEYTKGMLAEYQLRREEANYKEQMKGVLGSRYEEVFGPPPIPKYMDGVTIQDKLDSTPQNKDAFYGMIAKLVKPINQYRRDITPDTPAPDFVGALGGVLNVVGGEASTAFFGPLTQKKEELDSLYRQLGKDAKEDPDVIAKRKEYEDLKSQYNTAFSKMQELRGEMTFGKVLGFIALSLVFGPQVAGWLVLDGAKRGTLKDQMNSLNEQIRMKHKEILHAEDRQARREDIMIKAREAAAAARERSAERTEERKSREQTNVDELSQRWAMMVYQNEQMNERSKMRFEHEDLIGKLQRSLNSKIGEMNDLANQMDPIKGLPESVRVDALVRFKKLKQDVSQLEPQLEKMMKAKSSFLGLESEAGE